MAKKLKIKIASRSREAIQDHEERQDFANALRQAAFAGNEARESHAAAEEVDSRKQGRRAESAQDAALRLDSFLSQIFSLSQAVRYPPTAGLPAGK